MNTIYPRKAADLLAALVRHPFDALPYLAQLPLWGRQPIELELPWIAYGAIRHLEQSLTREHRVFEFGSGGSSFFFARRAANVVSVETDASWHHLVSETAAKRGLLNLHCEYHPLSGVDRASVESSGLIERLCSTQWDLVLLDGHCGFESPPFGLTRPVAFAAALSHVAPGGLIVLDDS